MRQSGIIKVGVIIIALAVVAVSLFLAPRAIEANPKPEYKFVRLVDKGAMPEMTEALNREAERGWKLEEMAVVPGEPGSIYLVFVK